MTIIYSINQGARCVTDGYDRSKVIESATEYFQTQREEDGEIGEWEEEVELEIYNDETDESKTEQITLTGETERGYDMRKEHGTY